MRPKAWKLKPTQNASCTFLQQREAEAKHDKHFVFYLCQMAAISQSNLGGFLGEGGRGGGRLVRLCVLNLWLHALLRSQLRIFVIALRIDNHAFKTFSFFSCMKTFTSSREGWLSGTKRRKIQWTSICRLYSNWVSVSLVRDCSSPSDWQQSTQRVNTAINHEQHFKVALKYVCFHWRFMLFIFTLDQMLHIK